MHKYVILIISIFMIMMSSCTKDRYCHCENSDEVVTNTLVFPSSRKKDAHEACEAYAETWSNLYFKCELENGY